MSEDSETAKILYCRCTYAGVIRDEVKNEVLKGLCDSGRSFESVADLCEMSARKDPALKSLVASGPVKIAACHARAVKWLFHSAGADFPDDETVQVLNMRDEPAENVLDELLQ